MHPITPRERLRLALDHQQTDRVPLDFGTGSNTSPVPEVHAGLAARLGLPAQIRFVPHIMRLAQVGEAILQALDIDTRAVYMMSATGGTRPCSEPDSFYDEWGVKWKETSVEGVVYREVAESPLVNATIEDLDTYPMTGLRDKYHGY